MPDAARGRRPSEPQVQTEVPVAIGRDPLFLAVEAHRQDGVPNPAPQYEAAEIGYGVAGGWPARLTEHPPDHEDLATRTVAPIGLHGDATPAARRPPHGPAQDTGKAPKDMPSAPEPAAAPARHGADQRTAFPAMRTIVLPSPRRGSVTA